MKRFEDKVAVVTGAAGGMGQALVIELARRGAHVAYCDIVDMESTSYQLKQFNVRSYCDTVDMGSKEEINTFIANVLDSFGHVDVLINNAGIALGDRTFGEVTQQDFEKITNINYWGVVHTTQRLYAHLLNRPEAAIMNVSSAQGILAVPYLVPYCTTKFAVRGFTDALRIEHQIRGIDNVSVHTVHPGSVATNISINADYHGENTQEFHEAIQRGVSAEDAANIMLNGIIKGTARIFISDARQQDILVRVIPSTYYRIVRRVMKAMKVKPR